MRERTLERYLFVHKRLSFNRDLLDHAQGLLTRRSGYMNAELRRLSLLVLPFKSVGRQERPTGLSHGLVAFLSFVGLDDAAFIGTDGGVCPSLRHLHKCSEVRT